MAFRSQLYFQDCQVTAAYNAFYWYKKSLPGLCYEKAVDMADARIGDKIQIKKVIQALQLPLKPTNYLEKVLTYGGIVSLKNKKRRFVHAMFVAPKIASCHILVANSLVFGEPTALITVEELLEEYEEAPRSWKRVKHWVFSEKAKPLLPVCTPVLNQTPLLPAT